MDTSVLLFKRLKPKFKMRFKMRRIFYRIFRREPLEETKRRKELVEYLEEIALRERLAEQEEEIREQWGIYYRNFDLPLPKGSTVKKYYDDEGNVQEKEWTDDPDDFETSPDFEDEELTDEQKIKRFT